MVGIHIAGPSAPGQFAESWADLLFVKGFDAGQPIVYLSTDAGQPLTAVLERSTYVPALNDASFNGGDDFLGSAGSGCSGSSTDRPAPTTRKPRDSSTSRSTATSAMTLRWTTPAMINALRNGGDLLNVFGDFPTLADPRHADAYSPLWDAQLGLWTPKAIKEGLDTRQIDEVQVFNLAATRPDLLTGVNPATGQPEPYGSVGVDINCAVIGWSGKQAPDGQPRAPAPARSSHPAKSATRRGGHASPRRFRASVAPPGPYHSEESHARRRRCVAPVWDGLRSARAAPRQRLGG